MKLCTNSPGPQRMNPNDGFFVPSGTTMKVTRTYPSSECSSPLDEELYWTPDFIKLMTLISLAALCLLLISKC